MPDLPDFGPLDVTDFTVGAMLRAGVAIRRAVRGAESVEEAAEVITRYLYEHCVVPSGERSCALVRFYKTLRYDALEPALQRFAAAQLEGMAPRPDMRCLTLLATAGDEPEWNARQSSKGHKAIALASAERVRAAPMITRLIEDLGVDLESLISNAEPRGRGSDTRTYDVFHVEQALGSPFIPAQGEFVERYRIASVVGFGGLLRSGELFAVILFSRDPIPARSAARFRTIALDVRSSLFAFDEARTWREVGSARAADSR
jgi:hypothetical protein